MCDAIASDTQTQRHRETSRERDHQNEYLINKYSKHSETIAVQKHQHIRQA